MPLTNRSTELELIDLGPEFYTPAEYQDCLKKLFTVNQWLGIFRDTKSRLKQLAPHSLLEVGCGGGLFLLNLAKYFPHLQLTGIDINPAAIAFAQSHLATWRRPTNPSVNFQLLSQPQLDYLPNSFDIVFTTLMCHHLTNEELIRFLQQACKTAKRAVILHDLHRHPWAIRLYRCLSPLLRNRLISHDGAISIRRSFTHSDWAQLLSAAGITRYTIRSRFPFRFEVVINNI
ncbi:MAG: methyltransferase domain-containing protein [Gammaproteobacteria bacterium]